MRKANTTKDMLKEMKKFLTENYGSQKIPPKRREDELEDELDFFKCDTLETFLVSLVKIYTIFSRY